LCHFFPRLTTYLFQASNSIITGFLNYVKQKVTNEIYQQFRFFWLNVVKSGKK